MMQTVLLIGCLAKSAMGARIVSHSRLTEQPPPRRPHPLFGGGGGGGNPFLDALKKKKENMKKTDNLKKLEEKAPTAFVTAPKEIKNAVFINREPVQSVAEIFDKWSQEQPGAARSDVKLLLVDFFAYSCTNCIRTIPHMRDLYSKYKPHGLEVIAFARPEFQFEGIVTNVKAWMQRNKIEYPVATDSEGTNWRAWDVDMWPTHLLVQKDLRSGHEGEAIVAYTHVGDRNGHDLLNKIQELLKLDLPKVDAFNTEGFSDAEVFLGKGHRTKNSGSGGCNKLKACEVEDVATVNAWEKGLPKPKTGIHTVYGAAWCPWCRKAKIIFELTSTPFEFIDVDEYGGPGAVKDALKSEGLIPPDYKSIPLVFDKDGLFRGGFDTTLASFGDAVSIDQVIEKAAASEVHYNKNDNNVTLRQEVSTDWKLDAEALVAKSDGSVLKLHAEMTNAETSGVRMFVVCEPGTDDPDSGWIQVDDTKKSITFPGRHFIKSFDGGSIDAVLSASKSMRVYVVWLSTEPYDPSAVA